MYSVYLRIVDKRLANKLKGAQSTRILPVGRDVVSRAVQKEIFEGFAMVRQDYSPAQLLASAGAVPRPHRSDELSSVLSALLADSKLTD